MNWENLISEALRQPPRLTGYFVSRKLAQRLSDKTFVEGSDYSFNLEAFARAGLCAVVNDPLLYCQTTTEWKGLGRDFEQEIDNAWLNVLWDGHLLDVLLISWDEAGCGSCRHWIVAETREIAESFFRAACTWNIEVRGEVLVYSGGGWHKNEELYRSIKSATFDNLILPDTLKEELLGDFRRFFAMREVYEKYKVTWKRGVLLIGPPGNGKTHAVKALINELGQPCLYVKSFKSYRGTEHDNLRQVFARARKTTPCLLVLEDLDSLVTKESRSFLLNELDGFAANTGLVVLATTNHPERLDPALLDRPSRFDRKYYFELPAPRERERYLRCWNADFEPEMRMPEALVPQLVGLTKGFSFAYLKELLLSSMMQWINSPQPGAMGAVMAERAVVLRSQMSSMSEVPPPETADEDEE